MSDTNWPVQKQKMARGLKFRKLRDCTIYVAKTKALISCGLTPQLNCGFVFAYTNAYTKSRFSHDAAHLSSECLIMLSYSSFIIC